MGDRANVQFVFDYPGFEGSTPPRVNLYSHWDGASLAATVVRHLDSEVARRRWGDDEYVCRIVVQRTMNELFSPNEDHGGGLGVEISDNEHSVLVLYLHAQTYEFGPATGTWAELCALAPEIIAAMAG